MLRSEYIKTIGGQQREHFNRQRNILLLSVAQEPKTKKLKNPEAAFFRSEIHRQLTEWKRRAFTGSIVLEIDFFSTARQPLPVQTLVKNYLDLLHKPMPHIDNLEKIVFKDDDQVKLLIANHRSGLDEPHIYIKLYRFSYFVKDAAYAQNILRNDFSDKKHGLQSGLEWERRHEMSLEPSLGELIREFHAVKMNKNNLPTELNLFQEDTVRRQIQSVYIKQNELTIEYLLECMQPLFKPKYELSQPFFERINEIMRENLFIGLDFIPMGGAPLREGEGGAFKEHIRVQLEKFVLEHPYLFPLLQPAGLTILCVPPAYNCPDADNLARAIIPFFDAVCRPPLKYASLPKMPTNRNKPVISTTSYQILYLPRTKKDPANGKIMVLLDTDVLSKQDIQSRIEGVIDKWDRHIRYKYY